MFSRTRRYLVGWTLLTVVVILLVLGSAVYLAVSQLVMENVDRSLSVEAEQIEEGASVSIDQAQAENDKVFLGGIFYVEEDASGQILANSLQVNLSDLAPVLHPVPAQLFATVQLRGDPTRVVVRSIRNPADPSSRVVLVVGRSLAPEDGTLQALLVGLLVVGALGVLLAFWGAWFLAGRALIPVQAAWTRQQQFVADASHELRTPLAVARATLDLLGRHRQEPLAANDDLFEDLRGEMDRLERLASDLLLLARLDQGAPELAVAPLEVSALAQRVEHRTQALATAKGLHLSLHVPDQPVLVEGDPDRLQQVLLVLLDNAMKHTPAGGRIVVGVRQTEAEVVLEVDDSGEGIAPEHLPHVFDRFYRADSSRSAETGGAGLGLAIAHALVQAHGGELTLTSGLGVGTCAHVLLPRLDAPRSLLHALGQRAIH